MIIFLAQYHARKGKKLKQKQPILKISTHWSKERKSLNMVPMSVGDQNSPFHFATIRLLCSFHEVNSQVKRPGSEIENNDMARGRNDFDARSIATIA
mmetsp:Transcript_5029/g.10736  ORF Transcript_5029/g.10736 Transcript_5029/m.10736 type:complete len:97 (+) Transcript_5029:691-981(+)